MPEAESVTKKRNIMPEAQTRRNNESLYIGSLYSDEDRLSYLPEKLRQAAPSQEPRAKSGQWMYRVAEPFYTKEGIAEVQTALEEGEISSAASYASKLSQKVKEYFDVPVAFPVSSGATALIVEENFWKLLYDLKIGQLLMQKQFRSIKIVEILLFQVALLCSDVGPGDQVIVPSLTMVEQI